MSLDNFGIRGLTNEEVLKARKEHGSNKLILAKNESLFDILKDILREPMVLLLLIASVIYFITGNTGDAIFLAIAIILVAAISLYQNKKSKSAIDKLKQYSQPKSKVIRDGNEIAIKSEEIVLGDFLIIEEGSIISADGEIIHSNDFSVNESILTGESIAVFKDKSENKRNNKVFMGTTVASGLAIAKITQIGISTELGKIGKSIEDIEKVKTPLEKQIESFVKKMVVLGFVVFVIVWGINYYNSHSILDSLLKALTLAMSILPEEIPVAFTTFMAMGAYRMMHMGIIVKDMKTVETLGSATMICTDKTGTITQNKMSIACIYTLANDTISSPQHNLNDIEKELISKSLWASEPIPFDPMEKAIHEFYATFIKHDLRNEFKLIHEYPLSGKPPMMTHVFANKNEAKIIAAKGAPEALVNVSDLDLEQKFKINKALNEMTLKGYRVLAVGQAKSLNDTYPSSQQEFLFNFLGLIAFYDPPKENIKKVFEDFTSAGIDIKIITGDNEKTTAAIAKQIHYKNADLTISGDDLMKLDEATFERKIMENNIFTRMYPEAKLKIINGFKNNGQIVAMTGDGVNDGPALKASHIGIAMGKKGTEIAKQAASLIIVDDDLAKMVDAIAMGRKIYTNLKKAIQYIISIHIPIILTVLIPLALGWIYPNIFTPVHVILLELIMGPTCSIIYENEPMEPHTMQQKPRSISETFFNWHELTTSIIQGIVITIGTLSVYLIAINQGANEALTRTMVFTTLIIANVFLTLINRSFYFSIFKTLRYKNNLVPYIIIITLLILVILLTIPTIRSFFKFEALNINQLAISIAVGFSSVIWYEFIKIYKRKRTNIS